MIWTRIVALFAGNSLVAGAIAAGVVMLVTWDWRRMNAAKEVGRQEVRVEIGKANNAAVETADRIRARAQSGSVRKHRPDPYTAD